MSIFLKSYRVRGTNSPSTPCRTMSPAFYRREATRYRLMAGEEVDRSKSDQFRRLAAESEDLADDLERSEAHPTRS